MNAGECPLTIEDPGAAWNDQATMDQPATQSSYPVIQELLQNVSKFYSELQNDDPHDASY